MYHTDFEKFNIKIQNDKNRYICTFKCNERRVEIIRLKNLESYA